MPMARDATPPAVPDGWRVVRLGEVAEVIGGSTPSRTRPDYWGGAIPWVVPSELTKLPGRYLERSRQSVTGEGLRAAGLRILPAGSTLLTSRATIGATAINAVPVTTNQGFQSLVPGSDADSLWLFYCVSALGHELQRRGAGSTFREVSRDGVRTIPILLPPLSEQRGIAAVLDAIDDAIERSEAVIAATEELRRSLLHELLSRGVPGWHSEWREVRGLGVVPACWEVARLGEVCDVRSGQADPQAPAFQELRFIAPDDIEPATGRLIGGRTVADARAISGKYEFDEHDVIYSKIRPYLMKVYLPQERGLCSADMYPIHPRPGLGRTYLALVLLSPAFTEYARTCSDRTGIPKINRRELLRFNFRLPPAEEQERIAVLEAALQLQWDAHDRQLIGLRSLKAALAGALLTGRVRTSVGGQVKT